MMPYYYPDAPNQVSDNVCYSLELFRILACALADPFRQRFGCKCRCHNLRSYIIMKLLPDTILLFCLTDK